MYAYLCMIIMYVFVIHTQLSGALEMMYHTFAVCNLKLRTTMHLSLATGVQFMRGYAFISYLLKKTW